MQDADPEIAGWCATCVGTHPPASVTVAVSESDSSSPVSAVPLSHTAKAVLLMEPDMLPGNDIGFV